MILTKLLSTGDPKINQRRKNDEAKYKEQTKKRFFSPASYSCICFCLSPKRLRDPQCGKKSRRQINMALEEIFVNIVSYSYEEDHGKVILEISSEPEDPAFVLTFKDRGVPFDPTAMEDPDIHLPGRERKIGGLGIYMVKQYMDEVSYEYAEGMNCLTIKKAWNRDEETEN